MVCCYVIQKLSKEEYFDVSEKEVYIYYNLI